VLVVVHVSAPSMTVLLLSFVVEELALLVEVLPDVRLQFTRHISHRCNVLFVLAHRLHSLLLFLFCFLFSQNFLFLFFFFCFLFSQNFLFSFLFFFQSELI